MAPEKSLEELFSDAALTQFQGCQNSE